MWLQAKLRVVLKHGRTLTQVLNIFENFYKKLINRLDIPRKKIQNRIPEESFIFLQRKVVPYIAILLVAIFTILADIAKASENNYEYVPDENVMDLSPAEVAKTVSVIGPYTQKIEEDPLSVALAMEDKSYLGKPVLATTEISEQPKSEEKRTKTIVYTVEGGDTISSIAWQYNLKTASIKVTNNLSSDTIRPGQQLKLPPQDVDSATIANLQKKSCWNIGA